jgi:hypothetical protein
MTRRSAWLSVYGGCMIAAAVTLEARTASQSSSPSQPPAIVARQEQAFRAGGLAAAAAVTGSYVRTIDLDVDSFPGTIKQLVDRSTVVGLGRSTTNLSVVDTTGRRIFTHYSVVMDRFLKGSPRGPLEVAVEGGRVSFNGRSVTAQVNVRGVRKPRDGVQYVWFLRPARRNVTRTASEVFAPVHDVLGVFDASQNRVGPSGRLDLPLLHRVAAAKMSTDAFVEEITQALRK